MTFLAGQTIKADWFTRLANIQVFNSVGGCTLASSSTTYVNVTNALLSTTKNGSSTDSDLLIMISVTSYRAIAATSTTFGVAIAGTDYDITLFNFNTANKHDTAVGWRTITGLAAGAITAQLRAKGSAANAMTIDVGDSVHIILAELSK